MEYIPPHLRDTRYALWFVRYQCRVPYIQTKTLEELEEDGLPTSGDRHHDHAMQWEPILMSLPIHRIAELWHNGANVSIVNPKDAKPIFEAISEHLHAWKNHIINSYHPIKPPYEDLLILDKFASVVYEHAKPAYDANFVEEHFKISSNTAMGRKAVLGAMARSDQRRREDKERGALSIRNIDYHEAAPRYDPEAESEFIDYSGRDKVIDAPNRISMASFFKKEKK